MITLNIIRFNILFYNYKGCTRDNFPDSTTRGETMTIRGVTMVLSLRVLAMLRGNLGIGNVPNVAKVGKIFYMIWIYRFGYVQRYLKHYFIVIGGHTARYCYATTNAEQPKRKSRALNDIQEAWNDCLFWKFMWFVKWGVYFEIFMAL